MAIYLHVGTAKTGTTTIQHAMFNSRDQLRENYSLNYPGLEHNHWGVLIPYTTFDKYLPLQRHILRRLGTLDDYASLGRKYRKLLEDEKDRYRTHVLSSEQLLGADADALQGLKTFLCGLGQEVKVLVYVRHPLERLSSHICQRMRSGLEQINELPCTDNITPEIQKYASIFGKSNLIIRRFGERYFTGNDLMCDFTTIVNGTPISIPADRKNVSLSLAAVYMAECGFSVAPLSSGKRAFDRLLHKIPGKKFMAPRWMAERTLHEYEPGLNYLAEEFGIEFEDFDLSNFPETLEWEFPAEAIKATAQIINDQALEIEELRRKKAKVKSLFRKFFHR
jgi:hypothetical protein